LLPSDVLGVSVYDRNAGVFEFKRGPIFAHIVLADEINRTTPRTQSALLESMNEAQVSVDGRTLPIDPPFMVVATQNPYEFEGTYALPENQLDRFLMQISLGYPEPSDEIRILEERPSENALADLTPVMGAADVVDLQHATDAVRMDRSLLDYVVAIAGATRQHAELHLGLSTRGSLALTQSARARALLGGRDYCIPEDITESIVPVCAHRVLSHAYVRGGDTETSKRVLQEVLQTVPSPA
ncbi:MAG: AAA family ATPase, partial [Planctomycetota bacterium]